MSVTVLHQDDPRYPRELFFLENPPRQLYAEGDLSLLKGRRVSVIGSRHPSAYGERIAYDAAHTLARQGAVIVSGMALGLDARAHRAALDAGGGTIAVLGNGMDVEYPVTNRKLLAEVRARGLVLTEYELGTAPLKHHFLERNRIIAALGQCLLVVEGRIKGGTTNTVEWAGKAGATLFGVPGHLDDDLAGGPNMLIHEGGSIYTHPNDILQKMGLPEIPEDPAKAANMRAKMKIIRRARAMLGGAEATVFDLIGRGPVHVDTLAARSEIEPGLLLAALSSLELQGLITQLPGKHFAIAS